LTQRGETTGSWLVSVKMNICASHRTDVGGLGYKRSAKWDPASDRGQCTVALGINW